MPSTNAADLLALPDAPAIPGLRFRRPRGDDADYEAMAAVIAAGNRHDDIPWMPTATTLREQIESSEGIDIRADIVIAEVDGIAVARAVVERAVRDGIATYGIGGEVVPHLRRRGLGRALLRENLRRVEDRGAAEPEAITFEPRGFADDREIGHRTILEQEGFVSVRWFFLMLRPTLADIPQAPLPAGLEFRPVTPDRHRAIFDAEVEAFLDHWQPREKTELDFESLWRQTDLDTDLWVVAWDGDEVAGVVQNWIWRDENKQLGIDRGWLEHISVRRPWRRRGLGRAMTAESLRRLRAAGMTEALLGVDAENPTGALGLYEGLGFSVHQRSSVYRRPARV